MKNYNDKDYNPIQTNLLSKILKASNEIAKKTKSNSANYIVVGSQVADSLTYHNRRVKIDKIKYKLSK